VLGLLTWVAQIGSPWTGFVVFFTLSLGLGLPLFVLALFSGQIKRLPRSGEWMLWVRQLMGWVLIGMAAYYLRALLPKSAHVFLLASVAVAAGVHLGWLARVKSDSAFFRRLRVLVGSAAFAAATLVLGAWLLRGPGVEWKPYSEDLLASSRRQRRPVIIDFYAEWCSPCVALDQQTFHDPKIADRARRGFTMIKVDLTRDNDPKLKTLLATYDVKGVPTIVFIGSDGLERKELRLVDFLPPAQFLSRMDALATTAQMKTNGG
jgi:thiol:disulfide interchange protein DsbD